MIHLYQKGLKMLTFIIMISIGIIIAAILVWKFVTWLFWPLFILFMIGFLPGILRLITDNVNSKNKK